MSRLLLFAVGVVGENSKCSLFIVLCVCGREGEEENLVGAGVGGGPICNPSPQFFVSLFIRAHGCSALK